jgi:glutamyl-tRNA synthetase
VLRIEDTDAERSTAVSEASVLSDLRWMGLDWDEGPERGGAYGPYRQSERRAVYAAHADRLLANGHAYYCFCSVEQLEWERQAALREGRPARYAGTCRDLPLRTVDARRASGERPTVRFRVPEDRDVVFRDLVRGDVHFRTDVIGDPVILRADGSPAYNFAVVVDDAVMAITHVVRGEDHISNTPRQILLYEALGLLPPHFAHLALVMGPDHSPLSKRHGSTSVSEFRAKGYLPEALVNYLALVGWSPGGDEELLPAPELVRRFSLDAVSVSPGVFDEEKLAWVNRHYLKAAAPERLAELVEPYFAARYPAWVSTAQGRAYVASVITVASDSVDRLDQVPARLSVLFDYDPGAALSDAHIRDEMADPGARAVVTALAAELAALPRLDRESFRAVAGRLRHAAGRKGKALFHPIRIALTGRSEGPELDLALPAIDRGADLPASAGIPPVLGCRERAAAFVRALEARR